MPTSPAPWAVKARRQNELNTEFLKYYEQKKNNLAAERPKPKSRAAAQRLDCFVASLLAMTSNMIGTRSSQGIDASFEDPLEFLVLLT